MRSKLQYPSFKFDNISKFQNVVSDRTLPPRTFPTHTCARGSVIMTHCVQKSICDSNPRIKICLSFKISVPAIMIFKI